MTKTIGIILVAALAVIGALYYWYSPTVDQPVASTDMIPYSSAAYGLSFEYPEGYFIVEKETGSPQRYGHAIVIVPDTQTNRDLMSGKIEGSDGPPTITIQMFQNNLDNYTTENWVRGTNDSNFKLSPDGVLTPTTLGGEPALLYRWSGLYEGMTAAVARPKWVYAFSVSSDSPSDPILQDYAKILPTVQFSQ
jgi:hypothetical protein